MFIFPFKGARWVVSAPACLGPCYRMGMQMSSLGKSWRKIAVSKHRDICLLIFLPRTKPGGAVTTVLPSKILTAGRCSLLPGEPIAFQPGGEAGWGGVASLSPRKVPISQEPHLICLSPARTQGHVGRGSAEKGSG